MAKKAAPLIIANWKMNGLLLESMQLFKEIRKRILDNLVGCEIVICPPFTLLRDMAEKTPGTGVKLGGQNCHFEPEGAFTGEISAAMLHDMTCDYVILGHSERRHHFNEGSEVVRKKAAAAHAASLKCIICVGETLFERDNHLAEETVKQQLLHSLPDGADDKNTVIAYEPVWSIGTNKIPTCEQIEEMHTYITRILKAEKPTFKNGVCVVYGGSANGSNAKEILNIEGVGGLLVGRASLDSNEFWGIIEAAS